MCVVQQMGLRLMLGDLWNTFLMLKSSLCTLLILVLLRKAMKGSHWGHYSYPQI